MTVERRAGHLEVLKEFPWSLRWRLAVGLLGRKMEAVTGRNLQATYDLIRAPGFTSAGPDAGGESHIVSSAGSSMLLRPRTTDGLIFDEVLRRQSYAPLVRVCSHIGMDVKTVIDAGANVGAFTLFITSAFPSAKVIALEPESGNYAALLRNIELNKRSKVQALNAAIWSENASLAVTDEAISRERELSFTVGRPSANGPGTKLATVEGLTLDALLGRLGTDMADVVKLDVEGAEAELFKTRDDIGRFMAKCRLLAIEIHDEAFDRIFFTSSLDELGIRHVQFGETLYAYRAQ